MMRILSPLQALLDDDSPNREWDLTYDCGEFGGGFTLGLDGQIEAAELGRVVVRITERTDEDLEAGVRALLRRAARAVRPEDVFEYFSWQDLAVGWDHGGIVEVDGEMLVVCDPEFLGVVGRSLNGCGAAIFNPRGVVRVDPEAPALERPPRPNYFGRQFRPPFTHSAMRRAKALFFRYLTREQKWELRAHKRVSTVGQDGRIYRIYAWQGGNVRLVEDGIETRTLCVVPNPAVAPKVPVHDLMLAHKLLLENAVDEFLKTARSWPV